MIFWGVRGCTMKRIAVRTWTALGRVNHEHCAYRTGRFALGFRLVLRVHLWIRYPVSRRSLLALLDTLSGSAFVMHGVSGFEGLVNVV